MRKKLRGGSAIPPVKHNMVNDLAINAAEVDPRIIQHRQNVPQQRQNVQVVYHINRDVRNGDVRNGDVRNGDVSTDDETNNQNNWDSDNSIATVEGYGVTKNKRKKNKKMRTHKKRYNLKKRRY